MLLYDGDAFPSCRRLSPLGFRKFGADGTPLISDPQGNPTLARLVATHHCGHIADIEELARLHDEPRG